MGGYGSGPYGFRGSKVSKMTTGDCLSLDIRKLKRDNVLQPGKVVGWTWTTSRMGNKKESSIGIKVISADELRLVYTITEDGISTPIETPITLSSSRCNYGHERAWFQCPECDERVALLYLRGNHFKCRSCHNLTYYSCQESGNQTEEAERRANAVLVKLKNKRIYGFDLMYVRPKRPKGMHWSKFCRLSREFDQAQMEYIEAVQSKLSSFGMAI